MLASLSIARHAPHPTGRGPHLPVSGGVDGRWRADGVGGVYVRAARARARKISRAAPLLEGNCWAGDPPADQHDRRGRANTK